MKENEPHRSIGSGTIRRHGLVGVDMAFLVCHWGWVLRFQRLKPVPVVHSVLLVPVNPDVELSAPSPAPFLSASHMMIKDYTSKL